MLTKSRFKSPSKNLHKPTRIKPKLSLLITTKRQHSGCGTKSTSLPLTNKLKQPGKMATATAPDITQNQRGVFILFEGLDRSGKTTHAKHMAELLNTKYNIPTQFMSFPNRTTETGQKINEFLQNKLDLNDKEIHQLFTSNRIECQDQIRTILQSGTSIVMDRYSYSGACFSAAKNIPGMDLKWCFEGEIGLPAPDIVIFMNVSPEVAEKRGGYGEERYEKKEFQALVRQKFDEVINLSPTWDIFKEEATNKLQQVQNAMKDAHNTNTINTNDECNEACTHDKININDLQYKDYMTPWYKLSSDGEFDDVTKAVQHITLQVIELKKYFPIHNISQLKEQSPFF